MKKFIGPDQFIFFVLLLILIANLISVVAKNKSVYLTQFNFAYTDNLYKFSQFAKDPADRKYIIDDPDFYSYSGYQYLRGVSPGNLNFEHPPLLKYFFGLSIYVFGNANTIQSIFGFFLLFVVFLISRQIFSSKSLAILPSLILSFDGIFQNQLVHPYLDLGHALFISLAIFFFLKATSNKKFYLLSSLFMGVTLASKYLGFIIIPVLMGFVFFWRRDDIRAFLRSLLLIPVIFLISYTGFFLLSSEDFISLHLRILRLYRSYLPDYPWGEIWRMLTLGDWRVWFGTSPYLKIAQWSLLWPLSLISALISVFFAFKKPIKEPLLLVLSWSFLYLFSASFHVVFPRHLLLYLPFGYILLVFNISRLVEEATVRMMLRGKAIYR